MTESAFPFGGPPQDPPTADAAVVEGATARRLPERRVLLLGGVGVLVLAVAAYFLFFSGSGSGTDQAFVAPHHVKKATSGAASAAGKAKPQTVPQTFKDVVGRDPFKPLYVAPASAPASGTAQAPAPAGSTTNTAPSTSGSTVSNTGTSSATSSAGMRVALVHVFTKDGKTYAQTKVNDTVYTPAVGETFATTFKLVSVKGSCATYLNGDEQFSLCEGQEVLK